MNINRNKLTIILFCSIVYIGLIFNLVLPSRSFSPFENRMLQQMPSITWKALVSGQLRNETENYVADQFIARDFWIGLKSNIEIWIGKKENNQIYFGKDGFLLEKFEKPSEEIINNNINSIIQLAKSGPENVFLMLVPNSVAIYNDKLPDYAITYPQQNVLDYIEDKTKDNLNFVNVYNSLLENKSEYIFFQTDHHWTARGAYYGYKKFLEMKGTKPISIDDFNIETVSDSFYGTYYSKARQNRKIGDRIEIFRPKNHFNIVVDYKAEGRKTDSLYELNRLKEKDKYTVFLDGNHALLTITTDVDNDKELLVIKDSFAHAMLPFLTNHYKTIHVIDPRYYNLSINEYITENNIDTILVLYNLSNFTTDTTISKLKR
ncbi:DHHW family protein [Alkaliphilus sp. B6464]|uniref:DHHW family protein n=1 Tax=Alkaliphilus sp. B6464 TaxID=2731219 RepID=UPI001BA7A0BC|nr:DHHW family protein [Alkaliphilus sp. B6464]QUH18547.1 hypothetical protein HYG84_00590 [Alkaliphilus sp. B6464]